MSGLQRVTVPTDPLWNQGDLALSYKVGTTHPQYSPEIQRAFARAKEVANSSNEESPFDAVKKKFHTYYEEEVGVSLLAEAALIGKTCGSFFRYICARGQITP